MRITFLIFVLSSSVVFSQSHADTISKNRNHIDSLIKITVDTTILTWYDSSKVAFLTITHLDDKYNSKHMTWVPYYYHSLGGPIIVGNNLRDSCVIYPILTKGNTSFFLLDDFDNFTDSKILLTIAGLIGQDDRSQALAFYEYPSLALDEVRSVLKTVSTNSNTILATKKWYYNWLEHKPTYRDQRSINLNYTGCK